ncbi:MAG: sodium:calcium antiporter [Candidatus Omnitrophica bacterium]|nr:sodium:calcium antiporter [Candidatus Omnitrophota bacterium]
MMESFSALWTFPAIILAAMLIAWAAECGQFFISQGLALAVLAWIQTLPEFAVEAVIALDAAKDPAKIHLVTANYTGSLRLFVGLGWPMVYFVSFFFAKLSRGQRASWTIKLEDEHAVAVLSLLPALLYFLVIYFKGTLNILDGIILSAIYFVYLYLLSKMPPHDEEEMEDLGRIPKAVMRLKRPANIIGIVCFFILGAVILYFSAHPFLNSMLALAVSFGISQFVFVQWVAPFLSEFPEKLSAFHWARKVNKAPMALINFVSSSINQWTILVAMIPFIYSFGLGRIAAVVFDDHQKLEILLTIVQSYLGFLFLVSMDFQLFEASALFVLWLVQFLIPGIRVEILWVYGVWAAIETVRLLKNFEQRNAFHVFIKLVKEHQRAGR